MNRCRVLAAFAGFVWVSATFAATPVTAPVEAFELMRDKSMMAGYGAESYRLVNEKDEIVSILRSGVTVVVKRIASPVVAVRGLVGTGGVYEGKWLGGGLSHLLEHLVAGGSCERRTEAENRNLLQLIGNNSNAYTTEDRTVFFVNTTPEHMGQAVDLVTGWMTGAKITPDEYRREYEVVQRELEMGKGEPERQFYYMQAMNRYHTSPARVPVIGYQEVIQGLSRDDVYNYYKLAYEPSNIVFTVIGDLDPEKMLLAVRTNVSDFKPTRVFSHDIAAEPPVLGPRTLVATFPKLGQARLNLGFEGVRLFSDDMYALDLLATILGAGDSSMLVQGLRDKLQLVSEVSATDDTPTFANGTFTIDMRLDPDKIEAATKAAIDAVESLKQEPVSADRIRRAKTQLRVAHVRAMQTAEDISTAITDDQMNTADLHFGDRYVERVAAVTPQQLQAAARRFFYRSRLITTVLLPAEYVGAKGLSKAEDLMRGIAPTTRPTTTAAASEVRKLELDNGVTLLLKRITTSPLVSMNMSSLGGVTVEDDETNGIGNLAMEMLTRGTKTRSADQIAEFFDSVGGTIDAGCGNNSWHWNSSCLKADFDKTIEVFADVANNPAFPAAELAPMKQRIDAAIAGEDADWTAQSMRFFKQSFYGDSHNPYRLMPIGTLENVDRFTVNQLNDWYKTRVLAGRRVIAIYGDINLDSTEAAVRRLLGKGSRAELEPPTTGVSVMPANGISPAGPVVNVVDVRVQKTQQALAGIVIGFKSDSVVGDPLNYTLDVGQTMAGGWGYPTGYLFETLRGKGLVYVVQAQNVAGRGPKTPGSFVVFAGCDPSKVNEVVDQILLNIGRLQGTTADMQEDWFKRSKLLITSADAMDSETPESQASQAALDELMGLGYDYHKQFASGISTVTMDQIRNAASTKLRDCVVTISTPSPETVTVKIGIRKYASFPAVDLAPRGVQHSTGVVKP